MTTVTCIGLAVLDQIFTVDAFPHGGGKYMARTHTTAGGGPAANGAVTVVRLGGEARFVGGVGTDPTGELIVQDLVAEGVDVSYLRRGTGTSSISAVLVDDSGERMIVNHTDHDVGAGLDAAVPPAVAGCDAVLADVRWAAGASAAVAAARSEGVPIVIDYDRPDAAIASEVLELATHVVFAAPALSELTGIEDPHGALDAVGQSTPAWLAVTLGPDGVAWKQGDSGGSLPAFTVAVVDTLGAGDVFHGAFALWVARGRSEEESLRAASAAAAMKCTRRGGRAGIPYLAELEEFLEERGNGPDTR